MEVTFSYRYLHAEINKRNTKFISRVLVILIISSISASMKYNSFYRSSYLCVTYFFIMLYGFLIFYDICSPGSCIWRKLWKNFADIGDLSYYGWGINVIYMEYCLHTLTCVKHAILNIWVLILIYLKYIAY